jgi:hypothetical protein
VAPVELELESSMSLVDEPARMWSGDY